MAEDTTAADLIKDVKRRMDSAVEVLQKEFAGLRTGRASAALLDPIMVDAYGARMPVAQVATVNVPEPRMISVQVWDRALAGAVEKAIRDSGLGLNPQADGQLIRVPLPDLSEERRDEISRIAHKYAEQARVAVRNVRRDGMDRLKRMEKDGDLSEDAQHGHADEIQKLTDSHVKKVDALLAAKDEDIHQV
ncbi:MAG: ribosome recycling factor [Alphaproteobacteria bacterium]